MVRLFRNVRQRSGRKSGGFSETIKHDKSTAPQNTPPGLDFSLHDLVNAVDNSAGTASGNIRTGFRNKPGSKRMLFSQGKTVI